MLIPDDPLDVSKMSREQREALKHELVRQHPELVEQFWDPSGRVAVE